jgi:phosphoglycerate dehydrogenase-like enzyme
MLGREQFVRMRPGARLLNIARGDLVDEEALVEALRSGRLAGAYLDVFQTEPLPPESPLWDMPNVIVTPHSGAGSPRRMKRIVDIFLDNLRRYLDGQPLRNVYQRERGY